MTMQVVHTNYDGTIKWPGKTLILNVILIMLQGFDFLNFYDLNMSRFS